MSRRERSRSRSRDRDYVEVGGDRRRRGNERRSEERRDDRGRARAKDFSHLVQPTGTGADAVRTWGVAEVATDADAVPVVVQKPNFGLSGALAKDSATGNVKNGIVMKWCEPPEARVPTARWRMYVFKKDDNVATLHLHRQSAYLFGREKKVADVYLEHESISKQHAVLQFRVRHKEVRRDELDQPELVSEVLPYIMDLKSTNHTFLNGKQIEHSRYIQLKAKDVVTFGESTREYVLVLDAAKAGVSQ
ncbi:hypothetical protein H257_05771 [Aphanomyces astaci]|uniref:FHA domain-containing protein n=2 Tax=Aphanomyces astaci TaxID=112090 RepID=W4GPC2_APHAT|nr:hypothetical protein H257_05771 [Aphanomyces astaci]ETV81186.1 hypothetical protein H257_05771 [Aphanomyces astaci]RHZ26276.1 hypothetical protein DYB37_002150 [Aphanomyces astaci]RQM25184.1 hypothetical protein B5M09_000769 [Aphanomyces astaci]|eukprot:XP_009829044.1 hypothetical protein H257_05771 [Aphanomyces astaci]